MGCSNPDMQTLFDVYATYHKIFRILACGGTSRVIIVIPKRKYMSGDGLSKKIQDFRPLTG